MDEYRIPVLLCEYLNAMPSAGDIGFIPEVWREGAATLWLTGGVSAVSEYIDGSAVVSVPFEIRLRCGSISVADRLDAVDFFTKIESYIKDNPLTVSGDEIGQVVPVGGAFKCAIYENGDEEYRAAYSFRYLKKA